MNTFSISNPPIQISSLEAAREVDHSVYDGIITIENTEIEYPLRVHQSECSQLILRFDDEMGIGKGPLPIEEYVDQLL